MRIAEIKRSLSELDRDIKYLDKINYVQYKKKVLSILKTHGLVKIDSGAYSNVYSSDKTRFVVKVIKHPGSGTYPIKYSKHFLKPTYVSKNRCVAIQKKVPILSKVIDVLCEVYDDAHDRNLGLCDGKLLIIDLDETFIRNSR